jgi:hypothetical protein
MYRTSDECFKGEVSNLGMSLKGIPDSDPAGFLTNSLEVLVSFYKSFVMKLLARDKMPAENLRRLRYFYA